MSVRDTQADENAAGLEFWFPSQAKLGWGTLVQLNGEQETEADSSLTTPKRKYVWGPVRSE
jgi:hypothetical protein